MNHTVCRWQLGGFVFTSVAGTLLHYLYDLTGRNSLFAVLSAVNESTWEHMKLLFIPMFVVTLLEMTVFGDRYPNFWQTKLAGILTGLLLIPALHYTYTGAFGVRLMWLDISLFYFAAAAAYLLETHLLLRETPRSRTPETPFLLIIWLLAFVFLFFTYAPPHIPLFRDPVTLSYGIA